MKILITGGTGYLGSKLTQLLIKDGSKVALLLRQSSTLQNITHASGLDSVGRYSSEKEIFEFIELSQPDVIVHTASCYGRLNESYRDIINANIDFGVSILSALMRIEKPVSFVNIATSLPANINFYAFTKNQFTHFGRWFCENSQNKLQFINLVVEHFYGAEESGDKFISYLLNQCTSNAPEINLTEGNQKRDFIYIDDLLSACKIVINKLSEIQQFQTIHIGSGHSTSIKELSLLILRLTKSRSKLKFGALPYRPNELMNSKIDLSVIKSFGWMPKVSIECGIEKMIYEKNARNEHKL